MLSEPLVYIVTFDLWFLITPFGIFKLFFIVFDQTGGRPHDLQYTRGDHADQTGGRTHDLQYTRGDHADQTGGRPHDLQYSRRSR